MFSITFALLPANVPGCDGASRSEDAFGEGRLHGALPAALVIGEALLGEGASGGARAPGGVGPLGAARRLVDDDVDDGVLVVSVGAGGTSTAGSAPASAHDEVPPAKTRAAARVAASRRFIGPTPPGRG